MGTLARRSGATVPAASRPFAVWTVASGVAVCVGFLVGSGHVLPAAGIASILMAAFIAYRWPVFAALAVLLISGGYSILATTPLWSTKATSLGGGVRLEDVFMVGMLVAALIRVASPRGRRRLGKLLAPTLLLGAWLAFETLRNVSSAGLSAPGELRFFYLVLSVAFCLLASLDGEAAVRSAIKGFVLIAVALPLVLLPLVLATNGWAFGPSARLFPSHVSLGLLLGLVVLWTGRAIFRWPWWAVYSATLLGSVEILLDAHRSVWLSAVVVLGLLLLRQNFEAKVRWAFLGLLLTVGVLILVQGFELDPVGVAVERGAAVLTLQDTTRARLGMWRAATPLIAASPIMGRGLGIPWDLYVPELGYYVHEFPHSVYVMALAELGAVGLLLFAWLWIRAWGVCTSVRRTAERPPGGAARRYTSASLGLASLGAIAAYGVAYGLEPYSVTLTGICLAGAMLMPRHQPPGGIGG